MATKPKENNDQKLFEQALDIGGGPLSGVTQPESSLTPVSQFAQQKPEADLFPPQKPLEPSKGFLPLPKQIMTLLVYSPRTNMHVRLPEPFFASLNRLTTLLSPEQRWATSRTAVTMNYLLGLAAGIFLHLIEASYADEPDPLAALAKELKEKVAEEGVGPQEVVMDTVNKLLEKAMATEQGRGEA